MGLKCLVFDCDGVILDSVPVKTRAFARMAEPWGEEIRDRFVMYHKTHGGLSRYQKFAWFFREVLGREITRTESLLWGNTFEEYALDEVRHCEMIPGALETLMEWHGKLPMYVCSGAPETELVSILAERDLMKYFKGVCGSPPAKEELLKGILREQATLMPEEVLMVGDSVTDEMAARHTETRFYGIGPELKGGDFPWSENLIPLNAWIQEHV